MKIYLLVLIVSLGVSWSTGKPLEGKVPIAVQTQIGNNPPEVTIVKEADDVDDVVEAAAKKAVDPQGVLDDDVVEAIVDPHGTLEDEVERAVKPLKAAEERREDAADRLEDALERDRDVAEDIRDAEEDRREDIRDAAEDAVERDRDLAEDIREADEDRRDDQKDAAEDAIERQLDPTGRLGVDVDIVDPRDPDDLDDLHDRDDDDGDREVKVVLSDKGGPPTAFVKGNSVSRNEVPVGGGSVEEVIRAAKIRDKTREAIAEFQEDTRELAEDIREINRGRH